MSSNLCADYHSLSRLTVVSAFARIPLFCLLCQPFCFDSFVEPLIVVDSGCNSIGVQHRAYKQNRSFRKSLLRKFRKSNQPASRRRDKPIWLAKLATNRVPRVLQWDCSLRDSLQGIRGTCLTCPNEPASIPFRVGYLIFLGRSRSSTAN